MYKRNARFPELFRKAETGPWWMFVPNPRGGRQLRESTGHKDERAAHARYLERVRKPEADPASNQKERSLADALDDRIDWLRAGRLNDDPSRKKHAAATIEFYEKKSRQLVRVLGADTPLSAIDHETIRRYIVTRTKETSSGSNIGKELTTLSCALRLAKKDGVACSSYKDIVPDDFKAVYVPKARWLTEAEVQAFCTVLNPKRVPVFLFLVCTGATYPSEVHAVRPSYVKGHVVHIPGTKRSTRDRYVHVPSYGRKFLTRAVKGLGAAGFETWNNIRGDLHDAARLLSMCAACRSARLAWARHLEGATRPGGDCKACAKAVPVAPCSPNDLRRTFAQWLVRSGVPYELAASMMGHNSTRMLELVYGRRDATAVAKLVEIALKSAPKGARGAA